MPVFKYKAMSNQGQKLDGSYTAKTKEEVIAMLKSNNYYPLSIEEERKDEIKISGSFTKVKIKDIAIFCRQFYTMLNAGASILASIDVLREQSANKKLRASLQDIYEQVQKGLTFSESMRNHEDVFPALLINMVESGEVSGNLDLVMLRMATHYEKENKLNSKIRGAMIYPIILSILSLSIVTFLLTFIMPVFVSMFTSSGVTLPLPTRIMLKLSSCVRNYWYLLIIIIAALAYSIKRYAGSDNGQLRFHGLRLKLPIIKGLNQKIIVSRFTRTLSTILSSGIPLVNALQVSAKVVGNKIVENKILEVREHAIKGEGLAEPIKNSGVFPKMLYSMIKIGEESGTLDEILDKTADFYDDELETALQMFTTALEPIMILIMGLIIGMIVISMVLPMFDMFKTVNY